MRMKNIYALLIIVLLMGCSKNATEPQIIDYSNYYPTSIGSWWIYGSYQSNAQYDTLSLEELDSVNITAHKEIFGKQAAIFQQHTLDPEFPDIYDVYNFFENNKIYTLHNIDVEDQTNFWQLEIDFDIDINSTITLADTNYNTYDTFSNVEEIGNSNFTLRRLANKTIKYHNNNYECICFDLEIKDKGKQITDSDTLDFTRNQLSTIYFAKDIGIIRDEIHILEKVSDEVKTDIYNVAQLIKHNIE